MVAGQEEERDIESEAGRNCEEEKRGRVFHLREEREREKKLNKKL